MKKLWIASIISLCISTTVFSAPNKADPSLALRCHSAAIQMNDANQTQESTLCKYLISGSLFETAGIAITHNKDSIASMSLTLEINLLNYAKAMECNDSPLISNALVEAASIQRDLTA